MLATVLFTDIVDSTRRAAEIKSEQLAGVATGSNAVPPNAPTDAVLSRGADNHDEVSDFAELPTDARNHLQRPKARPKLVWLNFALTVLVMVMLVWGLVEPPLILRVGVGIALVLNFSRVAEQSDQLKAHAASVVSVVALVFAASVLTGVLKAPAWWMQWRRGSSTSFPRASDRTSPPSRAC